MKDNPKHIRMMKEGKVRPETMPLGPLADVARVMQTGAEKYGVHNWRLDKIKASTYVGAIFRHAILEWAEGSDTDKDSGEHPLAHVAACCLIVMDAEKYNTLIDDRLLAESIDGDTGTVERVLRALPCLAEGEEGASSPEPSQTPSGEGRQGPQGGWVGGRPPKSSIERWLYGQGKHPRHNEEEES
jgi:hypothetical protein